MLVLFLLVYSLIVLLLVEYSLTGTSLFTTGELGVYELSPITDTYITEQFPNRNNNDARRILADGDPRSIAILSFNTGDINWENVEKAELVIIPTLSRQIDKQIHVINASYSPPTVTWQNMPELDSAVGNYSGDMQEGVPLSIALDAITIGERVGEVVLAIDDLTLGEAMEFNSLETGSPGATLKITMIGATSLPSDDPEPIWMDSGAEPLILSGSPSGELEVGTVRADLQVQTVVPADCKYSSSNHDFDFETEGKKFKDTGDTTHSNKLNGLRSGKGYNYYVICKTPEGATNLDPYLIEFRIAERSNSRH